MILFLLFSIQLLIGSEELNYSVKIKGIHAGTAVLKIEQHTEEESKITFSVRSNKLIDFFYKLRDNINMIVNSKDYSILEINKSIHQGRYKKNNSAVINYSTNIIYYNGQEINFKNKIYSPTSLIYFLREQDLFLNKQFGFQIFENGKVKNIYVEVLESQMIKINNISYDCYIIKAQLIKKNNLLKEIMTFYIDKSTSQIPVMIKSKIKQGEMVLIIK